MVRSVAPLPPALADAWELMGKVGEEFWRPALSEAWDPIVGGEPWVWQAVSATLAFCSSDRKNAEVIVALPNDFLTCVTRETLVETPKVTSYVHQLRPYDVIFIRTMMSDRFHKRFLPNSTYNTL